MTHPVKDPIAAPARRFVDQVALVTGAGGGIGSAIAERLAAEGATSWSATSSSRRARPRIAESAIGPSR